MNDSLKKIFLIGLGVTAAGKEKAEKLLHELSEGGGAAAEEAKSYLTKLNNKGKDKKDQMQNDFKDEIKQTIENLGFVTVDQYNELAERIATLEKNSKTADRDEASDKGLDDQATNR
jgi:polyhydroxyalkanoate synthesis regulator phasin